MQRTVKAESLARVHTHTHTHTHTINLVKINNNINMAKGNMDLSGIYYNTG